MTEQCMPLSVILGAFNGIIVEFNSHVPTITLSCLIFSIRCFPRLWADRGVLTMLKAIRKIRLLISLNNEVRDSLLA
jgi:hypothetical protein